MKKQLSAAILTLMAGKAYAFQAHVTIPQGYNGSVDLPALMGAKIALADGRYIHPSQCDAHAISGCNCPFCTQLRSVGRG
ncbi:hypothetical protein BTJ39_03815 [Izhakiella australiensis]|uniref:Uncharacterized protein n=1 Tax=Izhakiella australiensis TaxID=1926881 RepID=A0A1S8YQQ1_9GAMM|nr:hypothetical protein [Izhakiella australiensis]OON41106.1 hypothetical protein BTJ39_03815 [Izhakiella australiensis]